ncbi:MAG: insulinase family protein, partial [Firmicutes bacterium]|nr:insulinase family protein [Bacillota bacterium]
YEKDEDGEFSYKGVVFNEMKGALADASEIMEAELNRAMFPETPYYYISGGDPGVIPNLTYEDFVDAHRRFYSPTNGIIFLDGKLDIEQVLGIIDGEFLGELTKGERIAPPDFQEPWDAGIRTAKYEIVPDEPIEKRMRMAWGRGLGRFDEREKIIAMDILSEVLAGSNEAYLTKPILEKGLAEDVILRAYDGIAQPWVRLEVRNFDRKDAEEIEHILFGEITRLAKEGIDHDRLEAVMANQEFLMGERDFGTYPQGLFLGFLVMDSMLYGGAPEQNLEKGDLFDRLRAKMNEGYFEELLRQVLLDNPHRCQVILEPSIEIGEERREREEARLSLEKASWSPEKEAEILKAQERLEAWQASEDDSADLEKLPHLTLEDIEGEPENIPTEVKETSGITVLRHPIASGDVRYIRIYFDIKDYDEDSVPPLSFLAELLGTLPAGDMDGQEIIMAEQRLLGRLDFDLLVYAKDNSKDASSMQFVISFSVLDSKLNEAADLITKIMNETGFDREDLILDILKQCRQDKMRSFIMGGHSAAMHRVMAMSGSAGRLQEQISGYDYYNWMVEQEDHWNPEYMEKAMTESLRTVMSSNDVTMSVTAGSDFDETAIVQKFAEGLDISAGQSAGSQTMGNAGESNTAENGRALQTLESNSALQAAENGAANTGANFTSEGIVIPADIAFTVRGGDLNRYGSGFSGKMQVAARIIGLAYLWNVIRVQGGAYGTGMSAHPSGMISCYSYRDPDGAASLETFKECANFLREAASEGLDLTGFIIGAVSDASPLLTPRLKGAIGDGFYFRGVTWEDRCKTRQELLSTTADDLIAMADAIEQALAEGGICIVSSQEQIDAAKPDKVLQI